MKIAIIQEASRHPENAHMRECFCLQRAFDRHPDVSDVTVWGKGHDNFHTAPEWNKFDIIINIENYSHGWMPDVSKTTRPTKFVWSIDSHVMDVHSHKKIFEEGNYHHFLQATSIFVDRVPNSVWFPNAYDDTIFTTDKTPKISDKRVYAGFCGSKLNRGNICPKIALKVPFSADYWVLGEKMLDTIRNYKIHFNLNYNWDVNYRNFETCGLGTVLLTNNDMNTTDYEALGFIHGVNCLFWNSKDEDSAIRVLEEYQGKEAELESIGKLGNTLVSTHHTYYNRINEIVELHKGKRIEDIYGTRHYR